MSEKVRKAEQQEAEIAPLPRRRGRPRIHQYRVRKR